MLLSTLFEMVRHLYDEEHGKPDGPGRNPAPAGKDEASPQGKRDQQQAGIEAGQGDKSI